MKMGFATAEVLGRMADADINIDHNDTATSSDQENHPSCAANLTRKGFLALVLRRAVRCWGGSDSSTNS